MKKKICGKSYCHMIICVVIFHLCMHNRGSEIQIEHSWQTFTLHNIFLSYRNIIDTLMGFVQNEFVNIMKNVSSSSFSALIGHKDLRKTERYMKKIILSIWHFVILHSIRCLKMILKLFW